MIARNYIRYPEALRFQREMFSNGYHNSPRIMRLMECIFDFAATVPAWVKEAAARAKDLVKKWKAAQVLMNFKAPADAKQAHAIALERYAASCRWTICLDVQEGDEYDDECLELAGRYRSFCRVHQGGFQGYAGSKHRSNRYNG